MYIIAWYDRGWSREIEVMVSETHAVQAVIAMLESQKQPYKVSNRLGPIKSKHFGRGIYDYWIEGVDSPLMGKE